MRPYFLCAKAWDDVCVCACVLDLAPMRECVGGGGQVEHVCVYVCVCA